MSSMSLRLKVQASSLNATILAVVTTIGGLVVGLGIISPGQQGLVVATTTAGLAAAGVIANALHTGSIEPSAITTAVLAVVGQAVSLTVSFAVITNTEAGTIISVSTAVIGAVVVIAHALLSKQA